MHTANIEGECADALVCTIYSSERLWRLGWVSAFFVLWLFEEWRGFIIDVTGVICVEWMCMVCDVGLVFGGLVGREVRGQVEYVYIGGGAPRFALEHVELVCGLLLCGGSSVFPLGVGSAPF